MHFFSILAVSLFLTTCHALTTNKARLYKKYPQLLSEDTDPCIRGLNQVFINMGTAQ